jgi:hypothetical protein
MDSPEDLITNLLQPTRQEPDPEFDRLAHKVIEAAIEVHRQLGPGFSRGCVSESALH